MPQGIPVVKGHAYGNDFLLVPEAEVTGLGLAALARAMCHRLEGIGADGLITYVFEEERSGAGPRGPASEATIVSGVQGSPRVKKDRVGNDRVRMRLFNADGSSSEVSGNGVRCLAALVVRERPGTRIVTVETPAGPKILELKSQSGDQLTFRASMGMPEDIRAIELEAAGERVQAVALSVGNPQCVLLGDPLQDARMRKLGPAIEHHPKFPDRTNVSFVRVEAPDRIRMLIWERGVGPTQASGTGACGAAVAAAAYGGASHDVEVISPGGSQRVEWRDDGLYLTGWASLVFEGRWISLLRS